MSSNHGENPALPALLDSEQTVSQFLDEIDDGYFEADLHGRFMFVNEALTRMTGFSRAELLDPQSNHFSTYLDASTAARLKEFITAMCQNGRAIRSVDLPLWCRDGVTRHLDVSISLIRDAYGHGQGYRGFLRDMTEQRQLEKALRTSIQQLSMLQQVDSELSRYLDPNAILSVGLNAAMAISRADLGLIAMLEESGLHIVRSIGFGGSDQGRTLNLNEGIIGRALRTGRAQFCADVSRDPDYVADVGGMEANIVAPLTARDRVIGVLNLETTRGVRFSAEVYEFIQLLTARLAISLDNAVLLRTTQEQLSALQKLYAHVTDLEHLKTDMIRIAAHDMRGPLSVIASYVDLLRGDLNGSLDEAQQGYFDAITRGLDRLMRLSTDVLSLERIHARREKPSESVRFDQLVRDVVEQFKPEAEQRGVLFRSSVSRTPVFVVGEASELSEAISNLLTNALKYTPGGGKVFVQMIAEVDKVRCEVHDTGFGIPESEQARLFQPFYRVKTHDTAAISGTGLGLHLVKNIVERHDGAVYFESQPGTGSMFGFTLPLAPVAGRVDSSAQACAS
ncbi:MAG: PAS domain S-box protein [Anaerolineae bacterium]|nr:PAS domain S-box protein [Anaerolineae bacterium]